MPIRVRRFADPAEYGEVAIPFLAAHEAENCLQLGLISTLSRGGSIYEGNNYFAVVESGGAPIGAALMTPPFGPVVSRIDDPVAIGVLIEDLRSHRDDVPTVLAPAETARSFAERWATITGKTAELAVAERIFQLTSVIPPKAAPGGFREAGDGDRTLLAQLVQAFYLESSGPGAVHLGEEERVVASRLGKELTGYWLWEVDGRAVAMAGYGNPSTRGIVIGPVYTIPEFRGCGYASALTAALSQNLLDRGRSFVCLFTNLANPIANHVYKKIGYEPVIDVDQWKFS
jgi:uncharacterized protein